MWQTSQHSRFGTLFFTPANINMHRLPKVNTRLYTEGEREICMARQTKNANSKHKRERDFEVMIKSDHNAHDSFS